MTFTPTTEQQNIVDAFSTGGDTAIEALAGTGKTATLGLLAEAAGPKKGLYLAYNKITATEAAERFPNTVECRTAHSLAYRAVGYRFKERLNASRMPPWDVAKELGIRTPWKVTTTVSLKPWQVARVAMDTVQRFCYSSEEEPQLWHVPKIEGVEDMKPLRQAVLPLAVKVWEEAQDPKGSLPFSHDYYLAIWVRSKPFLNYDYLMLDEGQDTNGCVARLFDQQTHAQRIVVGDEHQQLYAWRGSEGYVAEFAKTAAHSLSLCKSFRFGPPIAEEANKWLDLLDTPLRLTGHEPVSSSIVPMQANPSAILCRTNAGVVDQAVQQLEMGNDPAVVGGLDDVSRFADAAAKMMAGESVSHRDLQAFASWGEVVDYSRTPDGADLSVFVRLVEQHGPKGIRKIASQTVPEKYADVVISTLHRSKGRQWEHVQIGDDINFTEDEGKVVPPPRPEQMLFYVGTTRAQNSLSRGPLSKIDRLLVPA